MSWTTHDIPDQGGRVAVVTGANGGLGLVSARELARAGAHVVMAVRDQEKADQAREAILAEVPTASLELVELDLASLASVETAADTIMDRHDHVHLLMNNAGLMAMPERATQDGFEMQFGVNHLGHWALTARLLPVLVSTPGARVVTVSSTAQHTGRPVDPENPHLHGEYDPWKAYGQAKLANRHFAVGLQRAFDQAGVDALSLACHPGLSATDLQSRTVREGGGGTSGPFWERLAGVVGMDPDKGALSQLRAATDPDASPGGFYGPQWVTNGPPIAKPLVRPGTDEAIRTLWAVSTRETGVPMDVSGALAAA